MKMFGFLRVCRCFRVLAWWTVYMYLYGIHNSRNVRVENTVKKEHHPPKKWKKGLDKIIIS